MLFLVTVPTAALGLVSARRVNQASGTAVISAGTLTVNGNLSAPNFQWTGATVAGPGGITLTGTNTWSAGLFNNAGPLTVPSGSTLLITTGSSHDLMGTLWTNNGAIIHSGGAIRSGQGSLINNAGVCLEQTDVPFFNVFGGAASTFLNTSTFRKSPTSGTTSFQNSFVLNNSGLVDVQSGTLHFQAGDMQAKNGRELKKSCAVRHWLNRRVLTRLISASLNAVCEILAACRT